MSEKKAKRYAMKSPDDEELTPPKRHEVITVELPPRKRGKNDTALHEFGRELEERMNYVRASGATIMVMQILENRGAIIIVDLKQPEPLRAQAIPLSAVMPTPPPVDDDDGTPRMHPELHNLLMGFSSYVSHSGIKRGTDKEAEELKSYFNRALSSTGGEELRQMLDSLKAVTDYHENSCDDGTDCDVIRFFKLAQETLSTYLNQRVS